MTPDAHCTPSHTDHWSLEHVLSHLQQPCIDDILVIGSLARQDTTPASDYDIVLIMTDASHPWSVGVTTIDAECRHADIRHHNVAPVVCRRDHD